MINAMLNESYKEDLKMNQHTKQLILKFLAIPYLILDIVNKLYSALLNLIRPGVGYLWEDKLIKNNQLKTQDVIHKCKDGGLFQAKFFTPNQICRMRATTFSTKEPETLDWIDQHGGGGVMFDIGANIGLYSVYYASTKKSTVYAFEPSFFNLPALAKNININGLSNLIKVVTNPLTNCNQFAEFTLSSIDEGGALSAFGVDYGFDGKAIEKLLTYQTLGFSIDDLFRIGVLKDYPSLIKIDVDGIEHLILAGAKDTLANPTCQSVLIEVTDTFHEQANGVKAILEEAGFILKEKRHSEMFNVGKFSDGYNQIWIKP